MSRLDRASFGRVLRVGLLLIFALLLWNVSGAAAVRKVSTTVVSLDGDQWMLAPDPDNLGRDQKWWTAPVSGAKKVRVSWIIQDTDAFRDHQGLAWFWRDFEAPVNPHPEGRFVLRFWSVDYKADVWVNGEYVGAHENAEEAFSLDVTKVVRPGGGNRLAVRVLNPVDDRPIDGILLRETPHRG